ncbi:cell division protein [Sphingomonas morindae]|uniref:Cell division protein n=1 Tax=Sphingomonas morindae TaxID=1541170 RepID=A0ABY4XCG3_9SPHN|nr:cell division protein [Sphingomonas morindae]USI74587.1 cell division protein [Sphingomonas morindae]
MPWVIAIMMFLTALAAAGGLALGTAAQGLRGGMNGTVTVQVIVADPVERARQAAAATAALRRTPGVRAVRPLGEAELAALLKPWLGEAGLDSDLPLPAMIDARLDPETIDPARLQAVLAPLAPAARIDDHGRWLGPLLGLVRALGVLAAGIVALMAGATAAAVVLAARAALDTHRATIDVLHMMGATDIQVARLFQRRLGLDAVFGAALGLAGAVAVILLIGHKIDAIGAGLIGAVHLSFGDWLLLALLPPAAGLLALGVARITVLRALGRTL